MTREIKREEKEERERDPIYQWLLDEELRMNQKRLGDRDESQNLFFLSPRTFMRRVVNVISRGFDVGLGVKAQEKIYIYLLCFFLYKIRLPSLLSPLTTIKENPFIFI